MAIVGFSQHHARDKSAKGKGKTDQIGGVANTQANGDDCQQKEFARTQGYNTAQQDGQQFCAKEEHADQENHSLEQGIAQGRQPCCRVVHHGQQDHHGHHGQVLHNQHANHHLAGKGAHPALVHQGFQEHHGAGQRNERTKPDRGGQLPAEQFANPHA